MEAPPEPYVEYDSTSPTGDLYIHISVASTDDPSSHLR